MFMLIDELVKFIQLQIKIIKVNLDGKNYSFLLYPGKKPNIHEFANFDGRFTLCQTAFGLGLTSY